MWASDDWRVDFNISDDVQHYSDEETISALTEVLNRETNNEFCRIRTSNMYHGGDDSTIYFRISSIGFNWFDLIWNVAHDSRNRYDYITVVRDEQSSKLTSGANKYYRLNGVPVNNMPIDDFVSLSGNPIIEHRMNIPMASHIEDIMKNINSGIPLFESIYGNIFVKPAIIDNIEMCEFNDGDGWVTAKTEE